MDSGDLDVCSVDFGFLNQFFEAISDIASSGRFLTSNISMYGAYCTIFDINNQRKRATMIIINDIMNTIHNDNPKSFTRVLELNIRHSSITMFKMVWQ